MKKAAAETNGTRRPSRRAAAAGNNVTNNTHSNSITSSRKKKAVTLSKKTNGRSNPKYPINTPLSKIFNDEVDGTNRPFSGKVVAYDTKRKLYSIRYEDDDAEEMTEMELTRFVTAADHDHLVAAVGKRKKSKRNDDAEDDSEDNHDDSMDDSSHDSDQSIEDKKAAKKPRIAAAAAARKEEKKPAAEILTNGRMSRRSAEKKINYADDDDDFMLDDNSAEEEEVKKPKQKKANGIKNGKKRGKKSKKKKADDSDSDAFQPGSESEQEEEIDGYIDSSDDDVVAKKKKKTKKAMKPAAKSSNKSAAKGKDGEKKKKVSMAEGFQPQTTPLNWRLSLDDIKKKNEFLDPCGMEATDDIIDGIIGEQLDKTAALLRKALEYDGEHSTLGSKNNPLLLGTACSGTDAPALALTLVQEQLEKRGLGDLFQHDHVFSCEKEPFKQAYLARNFDSILYPGECFTVLNMCFCRLVILFETILTLRHSYLFLPIPKYRHRKVM